MIREDGSTHFRQKQTLPGQLSFDFALTTDGIDFPVSSTFRDAYFYRRVTQLHSEDLHDYAMSFFFRDDPHSQRGGC